jgi:hypothetical protein
VALSTLLVNGRFREDSMTSSTFDLLTVRPPLLFVFNGASGIVVWFLAHDCPRFMNRS